MKSPPQRPIFVSVNIKQKYMKLILRLGLILFTGFISISTASAQLYGTADTNAPELRVPTSVKPAFDYWMRDTWAIAGSRWLLLYHRNDLYPRPLLSGTEALLGLERRSVPVAFQRYEILGSQRTNMVDGKRRHLAKEAESI